MWTASLVLACVAGALAAQQPAQAPPEAAPPDTGSPVEPQPSVKSQEEAQALMAMFQAPDAEGRIQAAQKLLTEFADTEFKPVALQFIAASYQQINDYENTIVWAERLLETNPKSYVAMLMLASTIAQRTREHDLDREEKLARVEKYAKEAQKIIETAPRPNPNVTDIEWEMAKRDLDSQAWEALALASAARTEYDESIDRFKKALQVASTQDATTLVRMGAIYNRAGRHDEAIDVLDGVISDTNVHPQIRQVAQAERARAVEAKKQPQKPEGATAPPQIEIKQP